MRQMLNSGTLPLLLLPLLLPLLNYLTLRPSTAQ
jgi:hypothetical protein